MPNKCFCDQRGIGDPTQTCGDCPENYVADELDRLRARVAEREADCYTAVAMEIDGHAYGLRPNAARIVREALRDAERYRWLRHGDNDDEVLQGDTYGLAFLPRNDRLDAAIDAAMATRETLCGFGRDGEEDGH